MKLEPKLNCEGKYALVRTYTPPLDVCVSLEHLAVSSLGVEKS